MRLQSFVLLLVVLFPWRALLGGRRIRRFASEFPGQSGAVAQYHRRLERRARLYLLQHTRELRYRCVTK